MENVNIKELTANELLIVCGGGVSASAVISGMADGATAGAAAVFYDDWGNSDMPDQSQPMYKMGDDWYIGY